MNDRTEDIQLRFDHHFETGLGLAVISMDTPRWACIGDLGPYEEIGWAYPIATNPADRVHDLHAKALDFWANEYVASWTVGAPLLLPMVFVYSPDTMTESVRHLDDHDLNLYLTCVEFMADRYVALRLTILDPEERLRQVENDLYSMGDGALALVSGVQMANLPPSVTS
jgi:hypothetical protein